MSTRTRAAGPRSLLAVGAAALAAGAPATQSRGELVYAVTLQGFLISFDSAAPGTLLTGRAITGLQPNERIVGIDFHPVTGELCGVGSLGGVYMLDPATGAAGQPIAGIVSPSLNGSAFGVDFDPVGGNLRIVSNADQNLAINPLTGMVSQLPNLSYPSGLDPNVVELAYSNAFPGATQTVLYGIDAGLNALVRLPDPDSGQLEVVANLAIDPTELGGFDIIGANTALLAYLPASTSQSRLAIVDLTTGQTTDLGTIDGGTIVTGIAVTVPAPAAVVTPLLTAATALLRRRR